MTTMLLQILILTTAQGWTSHPLSNQPLEYYTEDWIPYEGSGVIYPRPQSQPKFLLTEQDMQQHSVVAQKFCQQSPWRACSNYDATELPFENLEENENLGVWIDWTDPNSHFLPGFRGWVATTSQSHEMLVRWKEAFGKIKNDLMHSHPETFNVVLVVTGGTKFLMNHNQKPFFASLQRRCPTCVKFDDVGGLSERRQRNFALKLKFMTENYNHIVRNPDDYDTLMTYERPHTWDQKSEPVELYKLVYDEWTDKSVESLEFGRFLAGLFLMPDDLLYSKLVGPPLPEEGQNIGFNAQSNVEIPDWVRAHYSEWINDQVGRLESSDDWIRAGWREIKRICEDCQDWVDWYCGSDNQCRVYYGYDETDETFMPMYYLPGDRSIKDMQSTFALRSWLTTEQYFDRQNIFEGDAYSLYWDERRRHYEDVNNANEISDRWLGVPHSPIDIDQILRQEQNHASEIFNFIQPLHKIEMD